MEKLKPRDLVRDGVMLCGAWVLAAAFGGTAANSAIVTEQFVPPTMTAEFTGVLPEEQGELTNGQYQMVRPKPQPKLR